MAKIALSAFADEASEDFGRQLAALDRNRIGLIELRGLDGKNIGSLTEAEAKNYKKMLDDHGIKVWSLGSPLGKIDIDKPRSEHEELLRRLLGLADIFGTRRIRMFSYFVPRERYDEVRDEVVDRLRSLVKIAAGYKLCHENESAIFGATVDNCEYLYDRVEGMYSVFDSANFISWDEDIDYAIEKLADRADYFHVKDCRKADKSLVPLGYGDGKYDRIFKALDRDVTCTLEPHLFKFTGYSEIDAKELKNAFAYRDSDESFDAAVAALKNVLTLCGYAEGEYGIWTK